MHSDHDNLFKKKVKTKSTTTNSWSYLYKYHIFINFTHVYTNTIFFRNLTYVYHLQFNNLNFYSFYNSINIDKKITLK